MSGDVKISKEMVIAAGGDPNNCEFIADLRAAMNQANKVAENVEVLSDFVVYDDVKIYKPSINHMMHLQPIQNLGIADIEVQWRITAYILSFDGGTVRDEFGMSRLDGGGVGYDINAIYARAWDWSQKVGNDVAIFELALFALNTLDDGVKKK